MPLEEGVVMGVLGKLEHPITGVTIVSGKTASVSFSIHTGHSVHLFVHTNSSNTFAKKSFQKDNMSCDIEPTPASMTMRRHP